jgi:hypothetical protein
MVMLEMEKHFEKMSFSFHVELPYHILDQNELNTSVLNNGYFCLLIDSVKQQNALNIHCTEILLQHIYT